MLSSGREGRRIALEPLNASIGRLATNSPQRTRAAAVLRSTCCFRGELFWMGVWIDGPDVRVPLMEKLEERCGRQHSVVGNEMA